MLSKGPWRWNDDIDRLIDAEGKEVISLVVGSEAGYRINVSKENQKLIEVAPELLEELKKLYFAIRAEQPIDLEPAKKLILKFDKGGQD